LTQRQQLATVDDHLLRVSARSKSLVLGHPCNQKHRVRMLHKAWISTLIAITAGVLESDVVGPGCERNP